MILTAIKPWIANYIQVRKNFPFTVNGDEKPFTFKIMGVFPDELVFIKIQLEWVI